MFQGFKPEMPNKKCGISGCSNTAMRKIRPQTPLYQSLIAIIQSQPTKARAGSRGSRIILLCFLNKAVPQFPNHQPAKKRIGNQIPFPHPPWFLKQTIKPFHAAALPGERGTFHFSRIDIKGAAHAVTDRHLDTITPAGQELFFFG